jgi:hypothetical protein
MFSGDCARYTLCVLVFVPVCDLALGSISMLAARARPKSFFLRIGTLPVRIAAWSRLAAGCAPCQKFLPVSRRAGNSFN